MKNNTKSGSTSDQSRRFGRPSRRMYRYATVCNKVKCEYRSIIVPASRELDVLIHAIYIYICMCVYVSISFGTSGMHRKSGTNSSSRRQWYVPLAHLAREVCPYTISHLVSYYCIIRIIQEIRSAIHFIESKKRALHVVGRGGLRARWSYSIVDLAHLVVLRLFPTSAGWEALPPQNLLRSKCC